MLPAPLSSLMLLVLHQEAPLATPSSATRCDEQQRIELSLAPATRVDEICVSPGIMTGILFDAPVSVDIQDEVRFVEVLRGRSGISFVPPQDMVPGERLRLTVSIPGGDAPQSVTFTLRAHRGQATRQVEVFRDRRTRESYQQELDQERAMNQKLQEENQWLRTRLEQSQGLRSLFFDDALGFQGVRADSLEQGESGRHLDGDFLVKRVVTYRSRHSVAVEILLQNTGTEPWIAEGASLVTQTGEKLGEISIGQFGPIPPSEIQRVFVEANVALGKPRGEVTLRMWNAEARTLTLSNVSFPTLSP